MLPVSHGSNDLMPAKTCAFTHVQNSERGFSFPSSGIFLLMRYFQALKQSENFMPLWTISNIFIQQKSWFKITRYIFCLFCCCCCCCCFLKLLHYFSEETFSFLGNPSKALDHVFSYYYFPALFVIPISDWSVQILCGTSLTHHSSYGLFHIWLLYLSVSTDYFSLDPAKLSGIGNAMSAGWQSTTAKPRLLQDLDP